MTDIKTLMENARKAQQLYLQKHDVQLEIPALEAPKQTKQTEERKGG